MVLNRLSLSAENIGSGTDPKNEDEEVPKGFSTLRTRRYSKKRDLHQTLRVDTDIRTKTMKCESTANQPLA